MHTIEVGEPDTQNPPFAPESAPFTAALIANLAEIGFCPKCGNPLVGSHCDSCGG